jgi:enterochelin esterase-like enzyme
MLDWSFEGASARGGADRAVVLVPPAKPGQRFPVLVALHGRGEATRGAEAGAYGWVRDYRLPAQLDALGRGTLTKADFQSFVASARLDTMNASLATLPYEGLIIVCPHTPDLWAAPRELSAADGFGTWLTGELLTRVRSECPVLEGATGIDGVSLGGRVAWLVGTANARVFSAVGTLQAAFQGSEVAALARRGKAYREARPAGKMRLLSSKGDPFKGVIAAVHEALSAEGVEHEHLVVPGPHDYAFNRGPGGLEMLLWHDRVLRGASPV